MIPASPISPRHLPHRPLRRATGAGIGIGIALLVALLLAAILLAARDGSATRISPGTIVSLLRMTLVQASLTTILSLIVGIALAWALDRLRFPGRALLVGLFASAIVTPGMVVAFGVLAVWGRAGWINGGLMALGLPRIEFPVFGLAGIVFAHVILDAAFCARILLGRLEAIPEGRLKTGRSLGLTPFQRFRLIDWPAIRGTLPGLGAIVFLLAFTSFPIVLMLGGGPANQTFEVAIYSAVRLDFDLRGAVILALIQIALCGTIIIGASALAPIPAAISGGRDAQLWPEAGMAWMLQWLVLALGALGFGLPLLSVLVDGLTQGLPALLARAQFWQAMLTSMAIGLVSAALTLALALGLGMGRAAMGSRIGRLSVTAPAYAYLAVPAVVLSLGFFLLVRQAGIAPGLAAPVVVVIANALLALPFAIATLGPPLTAIAERRGRLIRALGLSGTLQWLRVEWPLLGRDIGLVFALAFCFSLGDLGVVALFGTQDFQTLPLLMLRALGAYRTNDAAAIAAVMLMGTIIGFVVLPRLAERLVHARA
ncbi:MAG: thiamine/thiamine pyrophosphate ABC transporter permease ThiP [Devosia sp.]